MEDKIPEDLLITLERIGRYNSFVFYTLIIDFRGEMRFKKLFSRVMIIPRRKLPPEKIKDLISDFNAINFFELRDQYMNEDDGCTRAETCHPSEILSIQMNGKHKKVSHYLGCHAIKVSEMLSKLCKKLTELQDQTSGSKVNCTQ